MPTVQSQPLHLGGGRVASCVAQPPSCCLSPSLPGFADPPDCRVPPIQGPLLLHWGHPIFPIAPALLGVLLLPVGAHIGSRMWCWETWGWAPGMT